MITIARDFSFDAAHHLPWHDGKCANVHGHTYNLTVEVSGPMRDGLPSRSSHGMIMDFTDLDRIVKSLVIDEFDHRDLNEVLAWTLEDNGTQPTAEFLVIHIASKLVGAFEECGIVLESITLWENAKSRAIWRRN